MKKTSKLSRCARVLLVCFSFVTLSAMVAVAQQPKATPGERGGDSDAFKKVEASSIVGNRRPGKTVQKRWYRTSRTFPEGRPQKGKSFLSLGVTIARGRLATEAEISDSRIAKVDGCVEWQDKKCATRKPMVLGRMPDNSTVTDRDQIQMTIEYLAYLDASGNKQSNRVGYLYVISREQYPGDKYGTPILIFPTLKTYHGDNSVFPGSTVAMPAPDRPWTISLSDSGKVQAFETYTIIVSPEPLKDLTGRDLQLEEKSIVLDEKLVTAWVRSLGGNEERGDLEDGAGQLVTQRESMSSGNSGSKRGTDDTEDVLKQDDPQPQMVFRKVVSPGGKMLITIRLPYKEAGVAKSSIL